MCSLRMMTSSRNNCLFSLYRCSSPYEAARYDAKNTRSNRAVYTLYESANTIAGITTGNGPLAACVCATYSLRLCESIIARPDGYTRQTFLSFSKRPIATTLQNLSEPQDLFPTGRSQTPNLLKLDYYI